MKRQFWLEPLANAHGGSISIYLWSMVRLMAKQIILNYEGEVSRFQFSKVSRDKLYGTKKKIVVNRDGAECSSSLLCLEGDVLVPPGGTTLLYLNENFQVFERNNLTFLLNVHFPSQKKL